jgi:tripartite-type tricarboxylate transporter receptor subunit TctC
MEMLNNMAGTRMAHIPYKGSPMADLMAGQLSVAFEPATTAIPLIRSGKLRALAVTSTVREPALPEVPPAADSVPGFSADGWQGFVVPTGTPTAITARLNAEIAKVLALPDVQSRLRDLGLHPVGNSVAEFSANMKAEFDKWGKVARDNDIRVE